MKIKLKRACLIGGQHKAVGDTVECPDKDASFLLARGFAEVTTVKKIKNK